MKLSDIHNVYFIGIGGIGMSALARYFKFINKNVSGYDRTQTPLTDELTGLGIVIHFDDNIDLISDSFKKKTNTLVVYTPAVSNRHSELKYFIDSGFEVKKRSEVLGIITQDTYCFAVAGTHGKTTTSCILAHLLKEAEVSLMAFLGGVSEDFNSNFILNGTEVSVVEADEYDRSFLQLTPTVACVTSMDADHLDIYGTETQLHESFKEFAKKIKPNGKLFVKNGLLLEGITFGIDDGSDFEISAIRIDNGSYVFDLKTPVTVYKNVQFNKPGKHNLLNALAAFAMACTLENISTKKLVHALATFKGVERRFSYQIKDDDFVYIDDYAHHPTEINAVYEAVTEMHPKKKITVVFQPHLYSRTRDFIEGFAKSLASFDFVLLLEIYPARELPIQGVNSQWLLDKIQNPNKKLITKANLPTEIKALNTDVLVTLGAGDIGLEVKKIKKELSHAS